MLDKLNTRYVLGIFFLALLLLSSIFLLSNTSTFTYIDNLIENQNIKYLQKDYKSDNVKFIYISDRDLVEIGESPAQINTNLANLINTTLSRTNAVVLDFVLTESGNEDADTSLANALNSTNASIIAYEDSSFGTSESFPPQLFFKNASYAGFRNFAYDEEGNADYYYPLLESNTNAASLMVSVAESNNVSVSVNRNKMLLAVRSAKADEIVKLNEDFSFKRIPINFSSQNIYNARDVLSGVYQPYTFEGSTVFIGYENDLVKTSSGTVPHAEYIANGVVTMTSNYTYDYAPRILVFIVGLIMLSIIFFAERSSKWWVRFSVVTLTIIISLFLNYLSAKYLHFYFNLSIPLIFCIIVFLFTTFASYFIVREELVRDSSVVNEIKVLNNIKISESTFNNYLISIAPSIIQKSGVEIVRPEIFQDAPILHKIFSDTELTQTDVVFKRGYILIPLSNYRKDNTLHRYCLLKSKLLVSDASVKNIIAFILSIDFHFKHIIETERENKLLYSIIEGIILSLNARDAITGEHSRRVAEFSVQIGAWLGYSEEKLEKLHFASLIHDIGKIGISDAILAKPSFFSDTDFDIMKKHPELGADIMGQFLEDEDIKAAILQHHERPDGKGYPYGISGDEIRPIANIIKIADVYDALISSRHYKDPWSLDKVCDVFYQGRGTEFDEELIDLVLENIHPAGWKPPQGVLDKVAPVFGDDIKAIAVEIYKNAMYSTRGLKTTEPTTDNIDFGNVQNVMDLVLGDSLLTTGFLYKNPVLIYTNEAKETTYYAKSNNGNYDKAVLVFLRNYHTGGCFISGLGEAKATFAEDVKNSFDAPLYKDKSLSAWASPNGQMFYVLFESQSDDLENVLVYFNKYLVFAD